MPVLDERNGGLILKVLIKFVEEPRIMNPLFCKEREDDMSDENEKNPPPS